MKITGSKFLSALLLSILSFSVLTLPYHLPVVNETRSNNIVDAVSKYMNLNPFSSNYFMTVKEGIEIKIVTTELRLLNVFLLKEFENQIFGGQQIDRFFRNHLSAKSLPLFLFIRYLRI